MPLQISKQLICNYQVLVKLNKVKLIFIFSLWFIKLRLQWGYGLVNVKINK